MHTGLLHPFLWLWLPLFAVAVQIIAELTFSAAVLAHMHAENGFHEILQIIVTFIAFWVALMALLHLRNRREPLLKSWLLLAVICCFYVCGEEASWGQHITAWTTPEFWMHINDQGETNLHNVSSWLDQKPRIILFVGVVVGGLIIPFLQNVKPHILPKKFEKIYGPSSLMLTASITLIVYIIRKVDAAMRDVILMERASEVEELFMFYFVLLYLLALRARIVQDKR